MAGAAQAARASSSTAGLSSTPERSPEASAALATGLKPARPATPSNLAATPLGRSSSIRPRYLTEPSSPTMPSTTPWSLPERLQRRCRGWGTQFTGFTTLELDSGDAWTVQATAAAEQALNVLGSSTAATLALTGGGTLTTATNAFGATTLGGGAYTFAASAGVEASATVLSDAALNVANGATVSATTVSGALTISAGGSGSEETSRSPTAARRPSSASRAAQTSPPAPVSLSRAAARPMRPGPGGNDRRKRRQRRAHQREWRRRIRLRRGGFGHGRITSGSIDIANGGAAFRPALGPAGP